jgi:hypothetical protein
MLTGLSNPLGIPRGGGMKTPPPILEFYQKRVRVNTREKKRCGGGGEPEKIFDSA